jgi:hypothetical protein
MPVKFPYQTLHDFPGAQANFEWLEANWPTNGGGGDGLPAMGSYDATVLRDGPVLYIANTPADSSGYGHTVTPVPGSGLALSLAATGAPAGTSFATVTFSADANCLLVLWATYTGTTTITSVTGLGLTWTRQATKAASASTKIDCWTATTGSSRVSGKVTIVTAATATVAYDIDEVPNVNLSTPLVASNIQSANGSGTAAALTYNPISDPRNIFLQGVGAAAFLTQTPNPGWTELGDTATSGPSASVETQVSPNTPSPSGGSTLSLSQQWAIIGIEINLTTPPTPPTIASVPLPNNEPAFGFNGSQYLEIANAIDLSVPNTGAITVECWMRPDVLDFSKPEGTGYVHFMGKGDAFGVSGNQEWTSRMYSLHNSESRPNRISGYAFLPAGGLGVGSNWQDPVTVGEWIHYALVIDTTPLPGVDLNGYSYDKGCTKIYKNGVLRDQDALDNPDINVIVPVHGSAPMRVGTQTFFSWFQGAVGKIALYPKQLTAAQILSHHDEMVLVSATPVIEDEGAPLVVRPSLNFVGAGVTAADDAPNNRTTVTVQVGYYSNGATHGAGTTITIPQTTHGLRANRGIQVQVQDNASGAIESPGIAVAANGDVTVTYGTALAANTKLVTLVG